MDASPLVKAHDHARAASIATQTADTTVAVSEHTLAAGEFSNAARNTGSTEALRTLKLLEQHHRRLSELLANPLEQPVQPSKLEGDDGEPSEKAPIGSDANAAESAKTKLEGSPENAASKTLSAQQAAMAPQQRRYPPSRELSSSIASNLASARGIRSRYRGQPVAPSVSSDQAPGNVDSQARKDGSWAQMQTMLQPKGKPSWIPPAQAAEAATDPTAAETEPAAKAGGKTQQQQQADEGYSRFYSTFGSLINRLSAPLAFAGLPLIAEEATAPEPAPASEPSPQKRSRTKTSHVAAADPQLSKIYSKAALRAVSRDGQGATDSFYVVPKTGHTVSYASILTFDQKEKRRIAASVHGDEELLEEPDEDDFVDARESQLSPGIKKRLGRGRAEKDLQNLVEELHTENQGLKTMLDKLSKRLHAFEANAQNSHMALQESMRFMRPGSPLSSSGGRPAPAVDETLRRRMRELEDELAQSAKQMERLEKENGRMEKNLEMYRDKWEKLKAGAKARREAMGSAYNSELSRAPS